MSKRVPVSDKPYELGSEPVEILCDNAGSFQISGKKTKSSIALIKCDRKDPADNERGLRIALAISDALNAAVPCGPDERHTARTYG